MKDIVIGVGSYILAMLVFIQTKRDRKTLLNFVKRVDPKSPFTEKQVRVLGHLFVILSFSIGTFSFVHYLSK